MGISGDKDPSKGRREGVQGGKDTEPRCAHWENGAEMACPASPLVPLTLAPTLTSPLRIGAHLETKGRHRAHGQGNQNTVLQDYLPRRGQVPIVIWFFSTGDRLNTLGFSPASVL